MKKILFSLAICSCVGAGVYYSFFNEKEETISFKTDTIEIRDIVKSIDATGTVEPEDLVDIAAQVSGEILEFGKDVNGKEIDFGSEIKAGDLVVRIDDEIQKSDYMSANASLESAKASRVQAVATLALSETNLRKAQRDWDRAKKLGVSEALSQASYDNYLAQWETAIAEVDVSKAKILQTDATIVQAEASLSEAKRNLEYCVILAPVNGVVIDRKVNIGQTVVSSMSASSLFSIAKDLKHMEVWASVNEADIAEIRVGQEVVFDVDAFPGETFKGEVEKIRLNATMSQNVVTYVVEVSAANPNLRLMPYLSANLNFIIDRRLNTLSVPNIALRFKPSSEFISGDYTLDPNKHYVWVIDGDKGLKPIEVQYSINNDAFSAISSPELSAGMEVVTGIDYSTNDSSANPFVTQMKRTKGSQASKKK